MCDMYHYDVLFCLLFMLFCVHAWITVLFISGFSDDEDDDDEEDDDEEEDDTPQGQAAPAASSDDDDEEDDDDDDYLDRLFDDILGGKYSTKG